MLGGGTLSSYSAFLKAALPLMLPTIAYAANLENRLRDVQSNRHHLTHGILQLSEKPKPRDF